MSDLVEGEARAILDTACEVIAAGWGSESANEFRRLVRADGAYLEPRTFRLRIENATAALLAKQSLSEDVLRRIEGPLQRMRALLLCPGERERNLLESPQAHAFAVFLRAARNDVGESRFQGLVDPVIRIGWSDLVVPGMDRYLQPQSPSFEHAMMVVGAGIRQQAEAWYKPMLQVALYLTPKRNGRWRASVPDDVGLLLVQCAETALSEGPVGHLLDPYIARIRNSEAHAQTDIDPSTETVTFVNRPKNRPLERLGPLSRQEVGEIVQAFTDRCLVMSLVYRAVRQPSMGD